MPNSTRRAGQYRPRHIDPKNKPIPPGRNTEFPLLQDWRRSNLYPSADPVKAPEWLQLDVSQPRRNPEFSIDPTVEHFAIIVWVTERPRFRLGRTTYSGAWKGGEQRAPPFSHPECGEIYLPSVGLRPNRAVGMTVPVLRPAIGRARSMNRYESHILVLPHFSGLSLGFRSRQENPI
jgi:hypothetical protein